jgi:phosphatidylglycerophosphate synthase
LFSALPQSAARLNIRAVPSIYDIKPRFQALLRPMIRKLAAWGCTPNLVTFAALFVSILVGLGLLLKRETTGILLILPIWLFVRMALNAIDGMMARELNMKSTRGAVLNELGDVVSDLALYLPLSAFDHRSLWMILAFCFGAILTEFCGILAQALGAERQYAGPMGKSDRAFFIGALGLFTPLIPGLFNAWPGLFALGAALTALTCWNRLNRALARLPKP